MTDPAQIINRTEMALMASSVSAQVLAGHAPALRALIEAERSMHSFLHVTDPTLYRRAITSDQVTQNVNLARAAVAFIDAAAEICPEMKAALSEIEKAGKRD